MEILVFDICYAAGHIDYSENIIRCLSRIGDVIICSPPDWYIHLEEDIRRKVYEICAAPPSGKSKRAIYRWWAQNILIAKKIYKKMKPDVVVCLDYHFMVFSLFPVVFPKKTNAYLMEHNQIDAILSSKIKRCFYVLYKNRVKHCVLEPFIGDGLRKLGVHKNKILVWPFPLTVKRCKPISERLYDFVGLCEANDELLIKKIVEYEILTEEFKKNDLRIVLRSRNITYDNGYLKVINKFIPEEEYYNYYYEAKRVVTLFPQTFRYRTSGTVMDAFSFSCPVVSVDVPLSRYFNNKYPKIFSIIDRDNPWKQLMIRKPFDNNLDMMFKQAQKDHSFVRLVEDIKKSVENYDEHFK